MGVPALQAEVGTEIAVLLKLRYAEGIKLQTKREALMWNLIGAASLDAAGDHFEGPARMSHAQSIGPRPLRTKLPVPVPATDVRYSIYNKYMYATFDITGPDMIRAKGNPASFVNGLTDRMDDLRKSLVKDANFQCYLPGTGIYATITGIGGPANTVDVDRVKYLRAGMRLDVWDDSANQLLFGSANATVAANYLQITAIDAKNRRVTLNNNRPAGIAVGDSLLRETGLATAATAVGIFFNGLGAIVDDGTNVNVFEGINRTTYPQWKSTVIDSQGLLTLDLMQQLVDVPESISQETIDTLWGSRAARAEYLKLLVAQKRFMDDKLDGGFKVLDFNGKNFYIDDDCPDDVIFGFVKSLLEKLELEGPDFASETGEVLKWDPNQGDTLTGYMRLFGNLASRQPNAFGKIINLPVSANYLVNAI